MTDTLTKPENVWPEMAPELPRSSGELVATGPTGMSLDELAAKFRFMHMRMEYGMRMQIAQQIQCGWILIQMQAQQRKEIGKGYWRAWVEANCQVTLRQVQRYQAKSREDSKLCKKIGTGAAMDLLAQGELSPAED